MAKYKRLRTDSNEKDIIKALKKIHKVVENGHDDVLVHTNKGLFLLEIKAKCPFNKNGTIQTSNGYIKNNQINLLLNGCDNYAIIWTIEQAIKFCDGKGVRSYKEGEIPLIPSFFRKNYMTLLSEKERKRFGL